MSMKVSVSDIDLTLKDMTTSSEDSGRDKRATSTSGEDEINDVLLAEALAKMEDEYRDKEKKAGEGLFFIMVAGAVFSVIVLRFMDMI